MPVEILKIAILPTEPFIVDIKPNGAIVVIDGFETELLDMIIRGLQMEYQLLLPRENTWGAENDDGNWTGLVGTLQRKEADIAIGSMFISDARRSVIDFSAPYTWYDITFSTKKTANLPKAEAFFYPFSNILWIYFFVAFVSFMLFLRVYPTNKNSLSKDFLDVTGILLRQPACIREQKLDSRLVFMSWNLYSFFISYFYTSFLLSFLTLPMKEHGIRSVAELSKAVSQGKYRCAIQKGSSIAGTLYKSTREEERVLGRFMVDNEMYLDFRISVVEKYLEDGKSALISSREIFQLLFQDKFYISDDTFYSHPSAIAMRKDFRYKEELNKILKITNGAGIYMKCFKQYIFRKKLKTAKMQVYAESVKHLSLNDLYGIFVVLGLGNILAFFICMMERLVFRLKQDSVDSTIVKKK